MERAASIALPLTDTLSSFTCANGYPVFSKLSNSLADKLWYCGNERMFFCLSIFTPTRCRKDLSPCDTLRLIISYFSPRKRKISVSVSR